MDIFLNKGPGSKKFFIKISIPENNKQIASLTMNKEQEENMEILKGLIKKLICYVKEIG